MFIILKNQTIKLTIALMIILLMVLSMMTQKGGASTSHQTIPTMPPTTAGLPTGAATNTPSATARYILPTQRVATQTASAVGITESPTTLSTVTSTSGPATTAREPGNGTIPGVMGTSVAGVKTQETTGTPQGALPVAESVAARGEIRAVVYCLLGAGVALILVFGVVWYLRSQRAGTRS